MLIMSNDVGKLGSQLGGYILSDPFGGIGDNLMEFEVCKMLMKTLLDRGGYKYSLREGVGIINSYLSYF